MDGVGVGLTLAREATGLLLRFWRFNKRMHDRPEYLHHLRSYIDRVDRDCEGARRLILDRISSAAELDEQLRIIVDKISDLTEKVSTIVKTLEELEPTNVVGKWKIQRRTEAANTDIERLVEQILGQFQSFQLHLCILGLSESAGQSEPVARIARSQVQQSDPQLSRSDRLSPEVKAQLNSIYQKTRAQLLEAEFDQSDINTVAQIVQNQFEQAHSDVIELAIRHGSQLPTALAPHDSSLTIRDRCETISSVGSNDSSTTSSPDSRSEIEIAVRRIDLPRARRLFEEDKTETLQFTRDAADRSLVDLLMSRSSRTHKNYIPLLRLLYEKGAKFSMWEDRRLRNAYEELERSI